MAVRLEARVHRYIGLSTDTKPQPGHIDFETQYENLDGDIPVGSSFLEEDTARIYHWSGVEWRYSDSPEVKELRAIRGLLASIAERVLPGF